MCKFRFVSLFLLPILSDIVYKFHSFIAQNRSFTNHLAIQHLREAVSGTGGFLAKAKRYTDITELTPELLWLFTEKIVGHEKEVRWSKHVPQTAEIYYNGIGNVGGHQ